MPKNQTTWPEPFRREVGLRLKALALAVAEHEKSSMRQILADIGIPNNRWGNYFSGKNPADAYDCFLFVQRYGGTFEWIFRGNLLSIQDTQLRRAVHSKHKSLSDASRRIHAA